MRVQKLLIVRSFCNLSKENESNSNYFNEKMIHLKSSFIFLDIMIAIGNICHYTILIVYISATLAADA